MGDRELRLPKKFLALAAQDEANRANALKYSRAILDNSGSDFNVLSLVVLGNKKVLIIKTKWSLLLLHFIEL